LAIVVLDYLFLKYQCLVAIDAYEMFVFLLYSFTSFRKHYIECMFVCSR